MTQAEDEYADKDWWGDDEFSAYNACLAECPTCENTCDDEVGDVSTPMAAEESCDWHLENLDADDDEFEGWFFLDWAECMWALSTDTDNFGEEAEEHLYCGAECAWEINWEVEDANWEWDEDEYSDWDEYNE